ncbi:hypothetical protein ACFV6E_37730 [Streptomyces sp. NPDC059785]|uniref:hypothetical protein n=1 Tax=Streptomyces sp. NPDC059785 TaxID=3346945 RepID=UPI003658CA2E
MPDMCDPVVSIQRSDIRDAVEAHEAWGVLASNTLVLAPGPLDWLHDDGIPTEVLIVPVAGRDDAPEAVERITIASATVLGFAEHPKGAAALLHLTRASRHRPTMQEFSASDLVAPLAENPDVWHALEQAGAVPAGIRETRPARVLGSVPEATPPAFLAERQVRRTYQVRDNTSPDISEVAGSTCRPFPACQRRPPRKPKRKRP